MRETVVKIENLSKQYRLGLVGTGTLSHDLNRWWHRVRGKPDPYLKIGQVNQLNLKSGESANGITGDYVWALRDINLEVKQGEVLGIIGKNGAGKSTLLKILSRVTSPTTGSVKVKGRIGSLLEVGTGFHPEMTGRENIYMNGTIMGMTRHEITRKLNDIVDFAGVSRYINTPVKRYSSGMKVRLGFAVAAFLEPEILIVDEVLAVGDAEFQKRAIGKMQEVSKGEGRTVLFVSHNMGAVQRLCSEVLFLKYGRLILVGRAREIISQYLSDTKEGVISFNRNEELNYFVQIYMTDTKGNIKNNFAFDEDFGISAKLVLNEWNQHLELSLSVYDDSLRRVFTKNVLLRNFYNGDPNLHLSVLFAPKFLLPGTYSWIISINQPRLRSFDIKDNVMNFEIHDTGSQYYNRGYSGCVFPPNASIKKHDYLND